MHERTEINLRRDLKLWQVRQHNDGCLTTILMFLSVLVTVRFVFSPGAGAAFVMGLFLAALVFACLRLVNSAARVVNIRKSLNPGFSSEIIDVEVLAPAESHGGKYPARARARHLLN